MNSAAGNRVELLPIPAGYVPRKRDEPKPNIKEETKT